VVPANLLAGVLFGKPRGVVVNATYLSSMVRTISRMISGLLFYGPSQGGSSIDGE
jgi:hypothetical protein